MKKGSIYVLCRRRSSSVMTSASSTVSSSSGFGSEDLTCHSPGMESETSDYQRSTPSPRDSSTKNIQDCVKDLGFGDELNDDDDPKFSKLNEECRFSVMAAIADKRRSVEDRLALIRDPKIMRSRVAVEVERLSEAKIARLTKPETSRSALVEELLAPVIVSPKSKKHRRGKKRRKSGGASEDDLGSWFAKRSFVKPKKISSSPQEDQQQLIRPAVFTVANEEEDEGFLKESSKRLNEEVNPFVPPTSKNSPYLFGFSDDFECVPPEDLPSDDEDDEDAFKEPEQEVKTAPIEVDDEPTIDILRRSSASAAEQQPPTKLRFPNLRPGGADNSLIACKWQNCQMKFTSYGKLSDHLKVRIKHMRWTDTEPSTAVFFSIPSMAPNSVVEKSVDSQLKN